jgi:hypothetical protein
VFWARPATVVEATARRVRLWVAPQPVHPAADLADSDPSRRRGDALYGHGRNPRIADPGLTVQAARVSDVLIERDEVVAFLFNVSDIAVTLTRIERLLLEDDDGEEEADQD